MSKTQPPLNQTYLEEYHASSKSQEPFYTNGFWDQVLHLYQNKMFSTGASKRFGFSDLYQADPLLTHEGNEDFITEINEAIRTEEDPNFVKLLMKFISKNLNRATFILAVSYVATSPVPIFLKWFLEWVANPDAATSEGLWLAGWISLFVFLKFFLLQLSRERTGLCCRPSQHNYKSNSFQN